MMHPNKKEVRQKCQEFYMDEQETPELTETLRKPTESESKDG